MALKMPLISSAFANKIKGEESLTKTVSGIEFPNPVGLAAGFDKNAVFIKEFAALGFGFVEVGTITPKGQKGNPKPRIFRLPDDKALVNRMGFNNEGADIIAKRITKLREAGLKTIIGGNIGKNKTTSNDNAVKDYLYCLEKIHESVDYITLNVSSPNTPNLRELQGKEALTKLLSSVQEKNHQLGSNKPVFLKIAPDMSEQQIDEIIGICEKTKIAGLIATNTTTGRDYLKTHPRMVSAMGSGGLSGQPLCNLSAEILKYVIRNKPASLTVISSGGIMNSEEGLARLKSGADLIQLYTGFIYNGPGLISDIKKKLIKGRTIPT
jgi:dihydroorotate dehydrogenase